jgi:hypothetical protein
MLFAENENNVVAKEQVPHLQGVDARLLEAGGDADDRLLPSVHLLQPHALPHAYMHAARLVSTAEV